MEKKWLIIFVNKFTNAIFRPLTLVKRENEFDVRCSVKGGGLTGQAGCNYSWFSKSYYAI